MLTGDGKKARNINITVAQTSKGRGQRIPV